MTNILMVCLGNICRSPLAHGILESKLPNEHFYVDSAGTANYHSGSSPDQRSIAVAKNYDIDISHQKARQFKIADFDTFDHIYVMDASNFENVIKLARNSIDISKVKRILDFEDHFKNKDVPDPYYGDLNDFETVYRLLDNATTRIAKKLLKQNQ